MEDINDLEKLLQLNKFFDELPLPEDRTYTKSPHMLRANGNASLLDFFDMVSLIITNTMDDLHVDCMPDEKAYVIKDDPVEAINHPIVTFKVNEREHKDSYGYIFFNPLGIQGIIVVSHLKQNAGGFGASYLSQSGGRHNSCAVWHRIYELQIPDKYFGKAFTLYTSGRIISLHSPGVTRT